MLTVKSVSLAWVKSGDVVVFFRQRGDQQDEIVHRVMQRIREGVLTRGDAVGCEDAGVVSDDNLIGRVTLRERNGRTVRVCGGWIGLCRARLLHLCWRTRRTVSRFLRRPYGMLKKSGIVPRLWKPRITRITIESTNGLYIQYIRNRRVVARSWPQQDRFECRKPWDLVIRSFEKSQSNPF